MNYGIDLQKEKRDTDGTEYLLGSIADTCLASSLRTLTFEEIKKYLPEGELQRGAEDTMDCASRTYTNDLAIKFNYLVQQRILTQEEMKWLAKKGYMKHGKIDFSDAFIAIKSGTTRLGNSLKAPIQAIHKHGLIPKPMLPLEKDMTWEQYHDPNRITEEMEQLGQEFLTKFSISYERVYDMFADTMLNVALYAWPYPVNGTYQRVDTQFNHAVVKIRPAHYVFDNYLDTDGDWMKRLAPDYKFFPHGYRTIITRGTPSVATPLWKKVIYWFQRLWENLVF